MQIEEKKLDEIENLLTQSMRGIHLLYDNCTIAKILQKPTEEIDFFTFENIDKIQSLLSNLIENESLQQKQLFIQSLDPECYENFAPNLFSHS